MGKRQLQRALAGNFYINTSRSELEEGETVFEAWYPKMPGLIASGESEAEARANLEELRVPFLKKMAEKGAGIPTPDVEIGALVESETFSQGAEGIHIVSEEKISAGGQRRGWEDVRLARV